MKNAGRRRRCPICGQPFRETMPVGSGASLKWVPRPVCTKHPISEAT